MSLTIGGANQLRRSRRRSPEAAQRAQSAFSRRFYSSHPHACRACILRYVLAWILFYLLRQRPWWNCELHHRTMRYKAGTEPNRVGVPLCEKHHGRADKWRRKWEASWMGQYAPLITLARLWLLGYWITGLAIYAVLGTASWFAALFLAAHVTISIAVH